MSLVQAASAKEKDAPTISSRAMVGRRLEPSESPNFMGYAPVAAFSCMLFNRSKTDALGIVIIETKRTFLLGGVALSLRSRSPDRILPAALQLLRPSVLLRNASANQPWWLTLHIAIHGTTPGRHGC